jgi:hypothetical protein
VIGAEDDLGQDNPERGLVRRWSDRSTMTPARDRRNKVAVLVIRK